MSINIAQLTAASFMPGLQNAGQFSGQALIGDGSPTGGQLDASPNYAVGNTSNMTGTIFISLPDPTVISVVRVNLPSATGDLASEWFPLFGTVELTETVSSVNQWMLIMTIGAAPGGRNIYFNFVNILNSVHVFNNFPINIYGHLYTYPWA